MRPYYISCINNRSICSNIYIIVFAEGRKDLIRRLFIVLKLLICCISSGYQSSIQLVSTPRPTVLHIRTVLRTVLPSLPHTSRVYHLFYQLFYYCFRLVMNSTRAIQPPHSLVSPYSAGISSCIQHWKISSLDLINRLFIAKLLTHEHVTKRQHINRQLWGAPSQQVDMLQLKMCVTACALVYAWKNVLKEPCPSVTQSQGRSRGRRVRRRFKAEEGSSEVWVNHHKRK